MWPLAALIVSLFLASCTAPREAAPPARPAAPLPAMFREPSIVATRSPIECVAYARGVSGIEIRGDAWTWWDQAKGRYRRGAAPAPGAVMVFKRYNGSPGHVAVVTRVVGERLIVVDHADWLNDGRIHKDIPVADVSERGDWSAVRVWYIPGRQWGVRAYQTYGFVYPNAGVTAGR